MKALVTGASGFIGSALAERLIAAGIEVRGTYRTAPPPALTGVEWLHVQDIGAPDIHAAAVAGCDTVVHLAALAHQHGQAGIGRRDEFHRTNVVATDNLAAACRRSGIRRMIFVSSVAAVCSQSNTWVDETTPCAPDSDYGRSKLEAELALRAQLDAAQTDWCILRPPLAYGPGNPGNMARLMDLIDKGLPLPFAAIDNRRSFIFIDNLVDAIFTALRYSGTIRATFMLSDGSDFATPQLVSALAHARGQAIRLIRLPVFVLKALGRAGDVAAHVGVHTGIDSYSISRLVGSLPVRAAKFRARLCWSPPTDPGEALRLTGARWPGPRK